MRRPGTWLRRGLILLLTLGVCGCGQDVERLGRIGHRAADRLAELTGDTRIRLRDGWQAMRGLENAVPLENRVKLRLRWDNALTAATIQVDALGKDVVRLRGTMANVRQRQRAVELAGTTVGVKKVVDEMAAEEK